MPPAIEPLKPLRFLGGYPPAVLDKVRNLIADGGLEPYLARRYPDRHEVQDDKALYAYVQDLKKTWLRKAPPINKVLYDSKLDVVRNALGLHSAVSRVQGSRLVARKEIRIAGLFKDVAPEFLEMIAVHELAHLREPDHDKAFYQLCEHMLPDYHQREFDLRLLLTWRDSAGQR